MKAKTIQPTIEIILTKPVRISQDAHDAAKIHVAKKGAKNLLEYLSNLIILDPKRKK